LSNGTNIAKDKSVNPLARFLTRLGDIYTWQNASKACFIALGTSLAPLLFVFWYGLHYFISRNTGITYIPFTEPELIQAIKLCLVLSVYLFFISIVATYCVLQNKVQKGMLYFSLFSVAFTHSILFAMLGVFEGVSWLLIVIYTSVGLVFLKRLEVMFTISILIVLMIIWSVFYQYLPFNVRLYQFTNALSLQSMSAIDLTISWAAAIAASIFCSLVLDILMGAWRYREQDLHSKSYQDELTSLFNRRAIQDAFKEEFFRAKRGEYPLSVAMLDLDHFKSVNDNYGHPFGDRVLKTIAEKMLEITRKKDLVGRYGGEEFLIVFPECELDQSHKILERLRTNMAQQILTTDSGQEVKVTVSIGIASLQQNDKIEDLIARADQAMYQAKSEGRNRVVHE
jgi:diguanylate cyclase (GGDEF)-like protein